jgi:hypothetical protein
MYLTALTTSDPCSACKCLTEPILQVIFRLRMLESILFQRILAWLIHCYQQFQIFFSDLNLLLVVSSRSIISYH